jgi:hypothetical protein
MTVHNRATLQSVARLTRPARGVLYDARRTGADTPPRGQEPEPDSSALDTSKKSPAPLNSDRHRRWASAIQIEAELYRKASTPQA